MRARVFGAAVAAALILAIAAPASADILDLTDGKKPFRLPKSSEIQTPWGEFPTDAELRASGHRNLDLQYDRFEIKGQKGSAAQVVSVYVTDALMNENFSNGEKYGVSGYWQEAAAAFLAAAGDLTGAARQEALYKRLLAVANTKDVNATVAAAKELLASDEKTYYFGPAQEMIARLAWQAGQRGPALAALKAVIDAPGMNVRDLYNAKYLTTWLTKSVGADSAEKWAAAEKAYRDLLTEIDRHPERVVAEIPRFKTLMSLGESLRGQGKNDEAKKHFDQILEEANEGTSKEVLAGVYYGLGDVAFQAAIEAQKRGTVTPAKKEEVKAMFDAAALHYLRVVLLYGNFASQRDLFGATQGVARAFASIFTITGETDCDLGRRAYEFYRRAVDMQDRGEAKRILIAEGTALKEKLDAACKSEE